MDLFTRKSLARLEEEAGSGQLRRVLGPVNLTTLGVGAVIGAGIFGELVSIDTLLAFAIVCGGVLVLRRKAPDLPRPFRTPGMPWVPLLGVACCFYLMAGLPWATWERLLIWLVAGLLIYFLYGRTGAAKVRAAAQPQATPQVV